MCVNFYRSIERQFISTLSKFAFLNLHLPLTPRGCPLFDGQGELTNQRTQMDSNNQSDCSRKDDS